jgi:Fe-S-cluster containining protein
VEFIQIVDAALAEATRKSGAWLACRPGCSQCCIGPFAISQAEADRLREALQNLELTDPERALRVRQRSTEAVERLPSVSGDFEEWVDRLPEDEPCPVLDPETGTCDLYAARPVTCRVFGPPITFGGDAVGVCELCFEGATDEQIAACEVQIEVTEPESQLTLVAQALS